MIIALDLLHSSSMEFAAFSTPISTLISAIDLTIILIRFMFAFHPSKLQFSFT